MDSLVLELTACPSFAVDRDARIASWNGAAERVLGYSKSRAVGTPLGHYLLDGDGQPVSRKWLAYASNEPAMEHRCEGICADGTTSPLAVSVSAADAQVAYVVTLRVDTVPDWALYKRQLLAAEQSELRLQEAQAISGLGSWEFDLATGAIHWSRETFRLYGVDESEGEPGYGELLRFIHPEERGFFQEKVRRAIVHGEDYNFDNRIVRRDGSVCYTHAVGRPMRDGSGKIVGLAGTAMDITARKNAELALRESESRFRSAFESAAIGMVLLAASTRQFLQANHAFCSMTGYSESELLEKTLRDITHPDDLPAAVENASPVFSGEKTSCQVEKRFLRPDGVTLWARISLAAIREGDAPPIRVIALVENVTARKDAEERATYGEERWELALQGTNDGLFDWDARTNKMFFSPRWKEMLGFRDDELPSRVGVWETLVHPEDLPLAQAAIQMHLDGVTEHYVAEYRIYCKDGSLKWILARGKAIRDEHGNPLRMIGAHSDITARKQAEAQLSYQAEHDELTSLPKRNRFLARLDEEMSRAGAYNEPLCLCICDIDRFKSINDRFGHHLGDEVLAFFANLLRRSLDKPNIAGRMGGDEFHILFPSTGLERAAEQLEAIRIRLAEHVFHSAKGPFSVSASFGVTCSQPGMAASALLETADQALYRAKELGRNCVHTVIPAKDGYGSPSGLTASQLETKLRLALDQSKISVDFQPEYRIADKRLVCFEALARWNDPEVGPIAPSLFIPLAKRTGLIVPLGLMVMEKACRAAAAWRSDPTIDARHVGVAVNLSAMQLFRDDFVSEVRAVLARTGLPASALKLELTESSLLADIEQTIRKMEELRAMGVELLIDDFGTGYSCLSYMGRLPFTCMKIDRSFVHELSRGTHAGRMVSTLVALAEEFGMRVIAEGIETPEQFQAVADCGCTEVQGYWLGYPVRDPEDYLRRGYL